MSECKIRWEKFNQSSLTWWGRIKLFFKKTHIFIDHEEMLIIYVKHMDGVVYFVREEKL